MTPDERREKYARAFAEHDFERMGLDLALLTDDHPFWEIYHEVADVAIGLADAELLEAAGARAGRRPGFWPIKEINPQTGEPWVEGELPEVEEGRGE